jgi:hypothetical protein
MSDIFISYRRGTASPYARGIYERLGTQFGADRVFMDIDTMEPGVDFVEYIKTAVSSCRVLIVLIGPDWVSTVDDTGQRRLDDPEDFVRVEVTTAFERSDVRVIPVLVGDARPPKKADLPPELAPLTRRQALEMTDGRWDYDLGLLVKTIQRIFASHEPLQRSTDVTPSSEQRVEPAILDADLVARTEDRYAGIRHGAVQELAELLSSRDPAVVLAARQALTHMVGDDSRRVSTRAKAALAEAERMERERVEAEPGESDEGREDSEVTEPRGAASEGVERASASVEHLPADGSVEAGARPSQSSWFRRHAPLTLAAVMVALVGIAAVLFTSESDEEGGSNSPSQSRESSAIPTANPCQRTEKGWMVADLGAEEHHECKVTTSPPPDDLDSPSLVYGLFSSAAKARKQFDEGLQFEYENGAESCPQSSLRHMRDVLRQGDTACFVNGDDEYIALWWNQDRSRVVGVLDFGSSTRPENAVQAWERVISSE